MEPLARPHDGRTWWQHLDNQPGTREVIARAERCAKLTIPSLFFEEGHQAADQEDVPPEWQSYGAQLLNHLATRLMLALFAPSRPFARMDPTVGMAGAAKQAGLNEEGLKAILSLAEKEMVRELDRRAMRPKLFELLKQILAIGPTLLVKDKEHQQIRVMSVRHFRLKRNIYGRMHTLCIKEVVPADELDPEIAAQLPVGRQNADDVAYFILVQRKAGKGEERFTVKHYVEDVHVASWDKEYGRKDCPYVPVTWTLSDNANYGNSLVAEYAGDFAAFEKLCKAQTQAGVLASAYRWLKDPSATMSAKEFEDSEDGEVVSGEKGSLAIVNIAAEMANAMQAQELPRKALEQRLGRAFVLASAVVRDSERTTGVEIRQLAQELDTGLGGGYSRLAVDVQEPLAHFLLDLIDVSFRPRDIELTVVTGLDALSRSGDLANLKEWLGSLAQAATIPEPALKRLKWDVIAQDLATPVGIAAGKYTKSDTELNAELDAEAQRMAVARGQTGQPQPEGQAPR